MNTKTAKRHKGRYHELIQKYPLRPISSDAALDGAIAALNDLLDLLDSRPWNQDEKDYVDVLADLIERYEAEHVKIEPLPDADMLAFLIENKGATQAQVARDCGIAESTISEVISGTRQLSRKHIGKLCQYFNVGPGVFFGDC